MRIYNKSMLKRLPYKIIAINPKFFRTNEVNSLMGDATKAKKELGWIPKMRFKKLIKEIVEADLKRLEKQNKSNFYI